MKGARGGRGLASWLVPWLVTTVGCGPVGEDSSGDPLPDSSASGPQPAADAASPSEPTPFPDLDGESVLRTYELWIVNRTRTDVFIYASAGAGRVTLDTVPGRDSVRVNVRVRARTLGLDAEDGNGRTIRSATLELAPASSNRWEIRESGDTR